MRLRWIAAVFALLLAAGGCGDGGSADAAESESTPEVATIAIKGSITLKEFPGGSASYADGFTEKIGVACRGSGGFSDLREGATIIVRDAAGEQVGLGKLSAGRSTVASRYPHCQFFFAISDVPDGDGLLTIEISDRGAMVFDREDAESLAFSIG